MQALLQDQPRTLHVLDIGCAGGRNSVWLVEAGFDVHAVDASQAMIAKTRERLAPLLGSTEAERRVLNTRMDDLAMFDDNSFDLALALGVFQEAQSEAVWHAAVSEAARVLKTGAQLLVAHFSPDSDPTGKGLNLVAEEQHLYTGFPGHPRTLLYADEIDAWMARHGLEPLEPTESVRVTFEKGYRTTVNGLYRKQFGEN